MRLIQTNEAPIPAGHYSQAEVPVPELHHGFKVELDAVAFVEA